MEISGCAFASAKFRIYGALVGRRRLCSIYSNCCFQILFGQCRGRESSDGITMALWGRKMSSFYWLVGWLSVAGAVICGLRLLFPLYDRSYTLDPLVTCRCSSRSFFYSCFSCIFSSGHSQVFVVRLVPLVKITQVRTIISSIHVTVYNSQCINYRNRVEKA